MMRMIFIHGRITLLTISTKKKKNSSVLSTIVQPRSPVFFNATDTPTTRGTQPPHLRGSAVMVKNRLEIPLPDALPPAELLGHAHHFAAEFRSQHLPQANSHRCVEHSFVEIIDDP